MKTIALAVTIIASMTSLSAMAQGKPTGGYGGVDLGIATVQNTAQSIANTLVNAVGGSAVVTQDTSTTVGRLYGGYNFTENVGVELGYSQSANVTTGVAGVAGNSVAYTGTGTTSYSGVDYSVVLRPSISTGMNGLFFKLGGHSLTAQSNATLTGTSTASASSSVSGSATLLGIGYDWPVSANGSVRFAYTGLDKLAGQSGSSTGITSVGYLIKF